MHPDDSEHAAAVARRSAEADDTTNSEQRLIDSMGRSVWVLMSASVVRDESGEATHRIVQIQDVSERKRYEDRLQHLADHDPLTGLINRRRFEDELTPSPAQATEGHAGGAVLALDLDHFKYINDSLGHTIGDELIARVSGAARRAPCAAGRSRASAATSSLRSCREPTSRPRSRSPRSRLERSARARGDWAARPGGHQRERRHRAVQRQPDELVAEDLLAEADIAMYDAKEGGRDRCAVFSPTDRGAGMAARLGWVERIRQALAEERFVLYGQRIESLEDDTGYAKSCSCGCSTTTAA